MTELLRLASTITRKRMPRPWIRPQGHTKRWLGSAVASGLVALLAVACGSDGTNGPDGGATDQDGGTDGAGTGATSSTDGVSGGSSTGGVGSGGSIGTPPGEEGLPFEAQGRGSALRKVKNLMTGLPPTPEEVSALGAVPASGRAAGLEAVAGGPRGGGRGHGEEPRRA